MSIRTNGYQSWLKAVVMNAFERSQVAPPLLRSLRRPHAQANASVHRVLIRIMLKYTRYSHGAPRRNEAICPHAIEPRAFLASNSDYFNKTDAIQPLAKVTNQLIAANLDGRFRPEAALGCACGTRIDLRELSSGDAVESHLP